MARRCDGRTLSVALFARDGNRPLPRGPDVVPPEGTMRNPRPSPGAGLQRLFTFCLPLST